MGEPGGRRVSVQKIILAIVIASMALAVVVVLGFIVPGSGGSGADEVVEPRQVRFLRRHDEFIQREEEFTRRYEERMEGVRQEQELRQAFLDGPGGRVYGAVGGGIPYGLAEAIAELFEQIGVSYPGDIGSAAMRRDVGGGYTIYFESEPLEVRVIIRDERVRSIRLGSGNELSGGVPMLYLFGEVVGHVNDYYVRQGEKAELMALAVAAVVPFLEDAEGAYFDSEYFEFVKAGSRVRVRGVVAWTEEEMSKPFQLMVVDGEVVEIKPWGA